MPSRPKRKNKAPERFQGWISGEKHEPFTVRNTKKKIKVEAAKKKVYQAKYREMKRVEKQEMVEKVNSKSEKKEKDSKAERKKEIQDYQKQYRERVKAEKIEKKAEAKGLSG